MSVKNIVFSAGSIGGLSFVGAWKALEEQGIIDNVRGYSGCSIGSIMALLVSIGYTGRELRKLAHALRYEEISDLKVLSVFDNLGLDTGNNIQEILHRLVERKTGQRDLTFRQHYLLTGRKLWINASCVDDDTCHYYSVDTAPELTVVRAVRMSIAFPILIAAVRDEGKIYIDGGFHDPCPVHMFSSEDTLVFRVNNSPRSEPEPDPETNDTLETAVEFMRYAGLLMTSIHRRMYLNIPVSDGKYRVITLDTGLGGVSLGASKTVRKSLVRLGYDKTCEWLKDNRSFAVNAVDGNSSREIFGVQCDI